MKNGDIAMSEITREEFEKHEERIDTLEEKFDAILQNLTEIKHNISMNNILYLQEIQKVFLSKEEYPIWAERNVDNPHFRARCYPIIEDYFDNQKGKMLFKNLYEETICSKRDSFVKWVTFGKSVLWLVSTVIVVYVFRSLQTLTAVTDNIMQMVK